MKRDLTQKIYFVYLSNKYGIYTYVILTVHSTDFTYFTSPQYSSDCKTRRIRR